MNHHTQCGETPSYWKSVEAPGNSSRDPFVILSNKPAGSTRRDFLSLMGFTLAAASLTGCSRGGVQKAIPLVASSDQLIPGVPSWYATTCAGCSAGCSLLVKTCDGRPIKIEGNGESPLFGGSTCAVGQATVLSLYDEERLRGPSWLGSDTTWDEMDRRVADGLSAARTKQQKIVLLSGTLVSPSMRDAVGHWARNAEFRHIVYDPISMSALRNAHLMSFGRAILPHYRFDQARLIIGLEADFLGTWLSPVEFARQYAITRNPRNTSYLSHHIQFESGLSITGANADLRIPAVPSMLGSVVVALLRRVAARSGIQDFPACPDPLPHETLDAIGDKLWKHRGESLVVSGLQDVSVQVAIAALNAFLGNTGKTIDLSRPSLQRMGDDKEMEQLVEDMNRGEVGALILYGVNPAYDYADADLFLKGLEKVALSVSFSDRRDETSSHVHAICPDHHFLEAWGDAEPVDSYFSLAQPTISPLFETRAAQESLLRWLGQNDNYYTYLREFWRDNVFPRQSAIHNFDDYWDQTLRTGVSDQPSQKSDHSTEFHGPWREAAHQIIEASGAPITLSSTEADDRYELHLHESVGLRDGRHANNPWLQELPDPISRLTWGNAAAISPGLAKKLDLETGDVVVLKTEDGKLEIPVFIQPGQQARTLSIPLGYGRKQVGKAGTNVGVNAYPLARIEDGVRRYCVQNVAIEKTEKHEALAATQSHFSIEGRPIIREMTVAQLVQTQVETQEQASPSLWPARPEGDHSWGMVIDLNSCTGCSACVIACQAENNVPVVGKSEVIRNREMHWIRLDRYYSGSEDNPTSIQQPMMCQHCGRAPCETVCPVLATTHSSDGLNQQVYNRCVGTRYCLNNCPYKVRRFNWHQYSQNPEYDYTMESPMGRMVLNPEVTVRSRGVMEKCSMCIQRIQSAKTAALQSQRTVRDGDIQTACQQVCPTGAIVFGDLKDLNSRVSQLRRNQRYYHVLEDLGTLPNVGYLAKVRNPLTT